MYEVPSLEKDYIRCDWNEGNSFLYLSSYDDAYLRAIPVTTTNQIQDIFKLPKNWDFKVVAGSDYAILITLSILRSKGFNRLIMRKHEYAQVRAFCEMLHIEICLVDNILDANLGNAIVYFSNPGNPSCELLSEGTVCDILSRYKNSFFIIDNAYIEYHSFDYPSFSNFTNFACMRTASKFWGQAGSRIGLVAYPNICLINKELENINAKMISYNVINVIDSLAQIKSTIKDRNHEVHSKLQHIADYLSSRFEFTHRIAGNFIRFDSKNFEAKKSLESFFAQKKIQVRSLDHLEGLEFCVRLSYRGELDEIFGI